MTFSLKTHQWVHVKSDPIILTIKTSSVQGVCYQIPAGRHILQLHVSCPGRQDLEPYGFCIHAFSRDPIQIGSEESILKVICQGVLCANLTKSHSSSVRRGGGRGLEMEEWTTLTQLVADVSLSNKFELTTALTFHRNKMAKKE
jgi:hypothetical protein